MRRRSRRRPRRARSNRTHDWVIGAWGTDASLDAVHFNSGNQNGQPMLSLIDELDIAEHENHLTILRIVGQLHFMMPTVEPTSAETSAFMPWMMLGIKVNDLDINDSLDVTSLSEESGATDIEKSWMWLWSGFPPIAQAWPFTVPTTLYSQLFPFPTTGGVDQYPGWWTIPIDIKVKRKMSERQECVLWGLLRRADGPALTKPTDAEQHVVRFTANVRVLVAQGTAGHGPAAQG